MRQPIVFVSHDNGDRNLTAAEKYGKLYPVVKGHLINKFDLQEVYKNVDKALEHATKDDWVLLIGHPVLMGIVCAVFLKKTGMAKFLIWDRTTIGYIPLTASLSELKDG